MSDPWSRPADQPPQGPNPRGGEPPTERAPHYPGPQQAGPRYSGSPEQPTQQFRQQNRPPEDYPREGYPPPPQGQPGDAPPPPVPPKKSRGKRAFSDPLSITLIFVIVVALALAGLVGAELYARHVADQRVAEATSCVVQDGVSVSFGPRPFLLQHLSGHYNGIHITTDGNQLREAKGMKADIVIDDVRTSDDPNSPGTIGSLDATIDWSADGIKQTLQNSIPLIGSFISGVTTNPSDGTIELDGMLGTIVTQPKVVDGGIALEVVQLTGLGFTLPRETVQPALDAFSGQLTKSYPLDVHADSIQVTDTGVTSKFSAQNATMPAGGQDPCFAGL